MDTESGPTEECYPTEYQLDDLPSSARPHLNPRFSRNKQLNTGMYERILLTSSKAVYIYKFPKREPAIVPLLKNPLSLTVLHFCIRI